MPQLFPDKTITERGRFHAAWWNEDGSRGVRIYAVPAHRKELDGGWVEMDNTILAPWRFRVDGRTLDLSLAEIVAVMADDSVRRIALPDLTSATGSGNSIVQHVHAAMDVAYDVGMAGIKERIIIRQIPVLPQGTRWLGLRGTLVGLSASGLRRMPVEAHDADGRPGIATLAWDGDDFVVGVSVAWLQAAALPVTIDPTINTEGNDCDLYTYSISPASYRHFKLLTKFDVSSIPDGANITVATLNLYLSTASTFSVTFNSKRLQSQTWLESNSYATLNAIGMGASLGSYTTGGLTLGAYNAFNVRQGDNSDGIEADVSTGNVYFSSILHWADGSPLAFTAVSNTAWNYLSYGDTGVAKATFHSAEGANIPYLDVTYLTEPTYNFKHFQFFRDDSGLNASTPSLAEDGNLTTGLLAARRLRTGLYGLELNTSNFTRVLQYQVDGGGWLGVTASSSETVFLRPSRYYGEGDETWERLTNDGKNFRAGAGMEATNQTPFLSIGSTEKVEDEWSLRLGDAAKVANVIGFRIVAGDSTNAISAFTSNDAQPTWTVLAGQRTGTALTAVRLALESSFGVSKASPSWLQPFVESEDVSPSRLFAEVRPLVGDRRVRPAASAGMRAEGSLKLLVGPENAHKLLVSMLSDMSTTVPAAGVYRHVFAVGSSQPTFELQLQKHYREKWLRGGVVSTATWSVARSSPLTLAVNALFQQEQALTVPTFSPGAYSSLDMFASHVGRAERDDGRVYDLEGFDLRMDFAPLLWKHFGTRYASDLLPGKVRADWALVASFASDIEYRRFLGDQTGSDWQESSDRPEPLKLEWVFETGQDVAPGYPYYLKFTAYGALYETFPEPSGSDDELLTARPTLLVCVDPTSGKDIEVELQNSIEGDVLVS